ncbi:MAG: GPR endopeptidase [Clostridia bacterium]
MAESSAVTFLLFGGGRMITRLNRTDLAKESFARHREIEGVSEQTEVRDGIETSRIAIQTQQAAEEMEKPMGIYVTIEIPDSNDDLTNAAERCIRDELQTMLGDISGHILVIGLGNRMITPDSLGPRTVEKIFVTRHIHAFAPELAPAGMRTISALTPGVLGITGLETAEVVLGIVERAEPAAVLCIDALASERVERMSSIIQINNSGLLPGAGVGNRQRGLNKKTLGVPVYAIGVPTVVYASTIAREAVRLLEKRTGVGGDGDALSNMAADLVGQQMQNMVVTPKDVDKLVEDASRRLANGINMALLGNCYSEIRTLLMH